MNYSCILLFILSFCSSCDRNEKTERVALKFNRAQWDSKDSNNNYIHREQMVDNLLQDYTWTGLTKDSVVKRLGEPDGIEEDIFMLYHYQQKRLGSFVLSTQSMVVQIDSNNVVKLARTN